MSVTVFGLVLTKGYGDTKMNIMRPQPQGAPSPWREELSAVNEAGWVLF